MNLSIRNRYLLIYLAIYLLSLAHLVYIARFPLSSILPTVLIAGPGLGGLAWLLTLHAPAVHRYRKVKQRELIMLALLLTTICWYISSGSLFINSLLPAAWTGSARAMALITIVKKLLVFTLLPLMAYRLFLRFRYAELGLLQKEGRIFSGRNLRVFLIMSIAILLFQYFMSNGATPLREGKFTARQILISLPLCFMALVLEVGVVEEFFFRVILQSRLAVWLRSPTGGIVCSGLIFALAHVPGLYRSNMAEEGSGMESPSLLTITTYAIVVLSLTGVFLGIIWARTRSFWLIAALHAMVDLLPNLGEFVRVWVEG